MPEECRPFDHTLVDAQLWALLILLNELCPEREDPPHKVLLLVFDLNGTVVFLAEVPEVM